VHGRDPQIFRSTRGAAVSDFDIAIIGAGIAGASLAAEIGGARSVLLIEAEDMPGYHSTGRSAAFWSETYGGPDIQPLTTASRSFLDDNALLHPRGALHLGQNRDHAAAQAMLDEFARSGVVLQRLDETGISAHVTGLKPGWTEALWEPDCSDIDVAALHAIYLKSAKKQGVQLICNAPLTAASFARGRWALSTGNGNYTARMVVNAAGAWADTVAQISGVEPVGITPYRRTIMQLALDPAAPADLPLVVALDGSFYFKPEADGKLWLSPHDEIPTAPCDAAPEELDIALAIDRFQQVVEWKIMRLERKWAGLRSFAPDRLPVIGRDPDVPEFFWLAGQGGFGIQTAPAIAQMAAEQLLDGTNPVEPADPTRYTPQRLR
jgi:D-arginine dehydrogenase